MPSMTPLPLPPRGQGGGRPLQPHTQRIVLPEPGRKDFLRPGQGTTQGRWAPATCSCRGRAERLWQLAEPWHLAQHRAVVATSPPATSLALAPTHLAGTRLLRPDLTVWLRQPDGAGSTVAGVPKPHPRRAGVCGHAGEFGCSLGAWVAQRWWAWRGPRASSGQGEGEQGEPGLRPHQHRGPGAAFPFPTAAGGGRRGSGPRATWWAGGGAVAQATAKSILHP